MRRACSARSPTATSRQGSSPKDAIGALVATAKGDAGPFKAKALARGAADTSYDAADLAVLEEAAALCPPAVRSAMLGYSYDFRPFLAGLPAAERERMTVLVAENDMIFSAPVMDAVWQQAGIRTRPIAGRGARDGDARRRRVPPGAARVRRHIASGAVTPSRPSAVAIVRCDATHSPSRRSSTPSPSAPTT